MTTTSAALGDAVRAHVHPGSVVYLGNFGAQLYGVGYELIRQQLRDLHLVVGSGGLLLDQLIGAGVAQSVTFAHCWNPIGPAPAWNLRRAAEGAEASVEIRELSLGMLNAAFQAAAWNVPFLPIAMSPETGYATDGWSRGRVGRATSEFGDCFVVQALRPDVAFIHVDVADHLGNCVLTQPYGEHLTAAVAAVRTVAVAEHVLPAGDRLPAPANLAGVHVDTVVALPGAVRPDGTAGRYPRDVSAYIEYADSSSTPEGFAAWLDSVRAEASA